MTRNYEPWTWLEIFLFSLLGMTWFLPSSFFAVVSFLLFLGDAFHKILGRSTQKQGSVCWFVVFFAFVLHTSLTNLFELLKPGYIPFHQVYSYWGLKDIIHLAVYIGSTYTWIQYFRRSSNGLHYKAFALGVNMFFSFVVFFTPSLRYEGARLIFQLNDSYMLVSTWLGFLSMFCFYVNLVSMGYSKNNILKLFFGAGCFFFLVFLGLTQARTSLLALLLGLSSWLVFNKKRICLFILVLLMIFPSFYIWGKDLLSFLPERLTIAKVVEDRGSGRTLLWGDYLKNATLKDFLVGVGFSAGAESILYQKPLRVPYPGSRRAFSSTFKILHPHSFYLNLLLTLGLLGLVTYFYLFYSVACKLGRSTLSGKISGVFLAMLISVLVSGFTHNEGILSKNYCFFFAVLLSEILKRNDVDEENT